MQGSKFCFKNKIGGLSEGSVPVIHVMPGEVYECLLFEMLFIKELCPS